MRIGPLIGCALALGVLAAAGCGGDNDDRVDRDKPAASINVTAAIIGGRIHVSPRSFGAGPIRLIVSNQTATAQAVTFETDGSGNPGITQTTAPISPAGTGTIEVSVERGRYALKTADRSIHAAAISVGAPRPSAQDELLQP